MGNQPSSGDGSTSGGGSRSTGSRFLRTTGALGLSKAELDERCRPSGLYPSCNWEDKAIRKLIGDGKLSARLRGTENRTTPTDRECPICFLQYREVNTTKCCSAHICTECYLQVRPQKTKTPSPCPFCNHTKFSVTVAQTMNAEAMLAREETEQRFIEAKIRERAEAAAAVENRGTTNNNNSAASNGTSNQTTTTATFGSSLQNDERIATLRARSSSLSDHDGAGGIGGCSNVDEIPEDVLRQSFAMTPEERRLLENEMRAQHSHPLSLRLEAEAQERRLRNEQEFLRQNPHAAHAAHHAAQQRFALEQIQHSRAAAASRHYHNQQYRGGGGGGSRHHSRGGGRGSGSERRNWNQIVEAFERGGHGEVNSLDDLVVLEAAMILSMEEESRRAAAAGGGDGAGNNANAATTTGGGTGTGEAFDANRHANEGFPLVRSMLGGGGGSGSEQQTEQLQLLSNSLNSRRRSRNSFMRAYGGGGADNNMDGASGLLSMGGMSEDDQLAMAIAASLQDQQQQGGEDDAQEGERAGEGGEAQPDNSTAEQDQQQEQEGAQRNDDNTTANNVSSATNAAAATSNTTITAPPNDEEPDPEEEEEANGTAEQGDVTRSEEEPIRGQTPAPASASGSFSESPETNYGEVDCDGVVDCDDLSTAARTSWSAAAVAAATMPEDAAFTENTSPQGQLADALDVTNHGKDDELN